MGRSPLGAVIAAVVLLVSTSAHAQQDLDTAARAHFQSGSAYFDAGDYESALREFNRAYEMSHRAGLLYNISLANERLGQLGPAADALERYLAATPQDPQHGTLEIRLQSMRRRIAEQAATPPPTTPEPRDTANDPTPAPTPGEPRDDATASGAPIGAIIAFGAGGAGLVTFALFGGLALAKDSDLASSCGADSGRTCSDDDVSSLRTLSLFADIGLGVAVVGAALGTVLLLVGGGSDDEPRPSARVSPWIAPSAGGLAASGSF